MKKALIILTMVALALAACDEAARTDITSLGIACARFRERVFAAEVTPPESGTKVVTYRFDTQNQICQHEREVIEEWIASLDVNVGYVQIEPPPNSFTLVWTVTLVLAAE